MSTVGALPSSRRAFAPLSLSLGSWTAILLAAGLLWRLVRYLLIFPLWGDEAFVAVNFQTRGFAGLTERLEYGQIAPLGFLWTTAAVVKAFGAAEWALRLLPFLAGVAALFLFTRLARSLLGRHAALAAVAIFAASYYLVRHGAELKPYTFDLLASVVILSLAIAARRSSGIDPLIALGAACAAAVWFSYPAAFVAGGTLLVLFAFALSRGDRRAVGAVAASGVLLAASFAAMYALVGSKQQWRPESVEGFGHWADEFPPLSEPWRLPLWLVRQHTGNMMAYPNGSRGYGSVVTTSLVIAGAVSWWRRGRRLDVLLLLAPLPLMLLAAALRKYPYGGSARVSLHLAAPFCILAGQGLVALLRRLLGPRRAAAGTRIAALVMLAFIAGGLALDVARPHKSLADRERRDFVRELAAKSGPDDRWLVFGSFSDTPWAPNLFHAGGSAATIRYYAPRYAPGELLWGADPVTLFPRRGARTWLIAYEDEEAPFAADQWTAYRGAVSARLGPARGEAVQRTSKNERITLLEFGPE
jgi:Dolichyl-phosphate-mannose-protein mannosyltransferase